MDGLSAKVTGGEASAVEVRLQDAPQFAVFAGEESAFTAKVFLQPFMYAPVKKEDICGKVCYYWNNKLVAQADLTAAGDVPQKQVEESPGFFEKIWDFITGLFT